MKKIKPKWYQIRQFDVLTLADLFLLISRTLIMSEKPFLEKRLSHKLFVIEWSIKYVLPKLNTVIGQKIAFCELSTQARKHSTVGSEHKIKHVRPRYFIYYKKLLIYGIDVHSDFNLYLTIDFAVHGSLAQLKFKWNLRKIVVSSDHFHLMIYKLKSLRTHKWIACGYNNLSIII